MCVSITSTIRLDSYSLIQKKSGRYSLFSFLPLQAQMIFRPPKKYVSYLYLNLPTQNWTNLDHYDSKLNMFEKCHLNSVTNDKFIAYNISKSKPCSGSWISIFFFTCYNFLTYHYLWRFIYVNSMCVAITPSIFYVT